MQQAFWKMLFFLFLGWLLFTIGVSTIGGLLAIVPVGIAVWVMSGMFSHPEQ